MTDMFRIKIVVEEFFDIEPVIIFKLLKTFVGIDRLLNTLTLLTNRTIDDIEELKKIYNKGLKC